MKKTLKSIQKKHGMLNESYSWERTPGKALPTLADVQAKYNAKSVFEQVPGQFPSSSLEEQEKITPIQKIESFVNHVNDLYKQINESTKHDINTFTKNVREKLIEIES